MLVIALGKMAGLIENLKNFAGDYDCCIALQRGPRGGKKIVKKMPTIPHCGIQSAGWVGFSI